jgi:hypothetical protein
MKNRDKIIEFCNDLNLKILCLEYLLDYIYPGMKKDPYNYWRLCVKLPFNYRESFYSDFETATEDMDTATMFSHIEARIEHILNRNLTH